MKKLELLFQLLFFSMFSIIVVLLMGTMINSSLAAGFLTILLLYVLFLVRKKEFSFQGKMNIRYLWLILQLFSGMGMIWLAFCLEVDFSWDWGVVMRTAVHYMDTGVIGNPEYYAQYPNNQLWVVALIGLFKMVRFIYPDAGVEEFKVVSVVVMCLLIQLTIWVIKETARVIWDEKRGFFAGFLAILCLPLYLYAQFAYTDIPGMLLCGLLLYLYSKMQRNYGKKQSFYLVLLGITAAAAYKIKVMVFVVVIAIIIELFLKQTSMKKFLGQAFILGFSLILTMGILQLPVNKIMPISQEMSDSQKFPAAHWIMMGLNKTGGYQDEDVSYTGSFPTYEEKKAATMEAIKSRVKTYGVRGMIKHIFYTKMKRTWCVSSLNGDDYVGRNPLHDGTLQKIFTKKGSLHWICLTYTWIYHFALLLGILMSGAAALFQKNRDVKMQIGRISLLGVVLFLAIWECNSRYLVCFLPVLMLTAAEGLYPAKSVNFTNV